jgi:hypothetical protein
MMTFLKAKKKKTYQCPNKECRGYKKGMENIARLARDYDNWYCSLCGSHYAGYNGKLKFYTRQEWDKQFLPEYDRGNRCKGGKNFFETFK